MFRRLLCLVALCIVHPLPASAAEFDRAKYCMDGITGFVRFRQDFVSVRRLQVTPPQYPRDEERLLGEGWVTFDMTIGKDGVPTVHGVRDRLGSKRFVAAAEQAVKTWRYTPATLKGNPVEQYGVVQTVLFRFDAANPLAADHPEAVDQFKSARSSLLSGDARGAVDIVEKALTGVDGRSNMNLYEQAKFSLMAAMAYSRLGEPQRAWKHARRAIFGDGEFLSKDDAGRAWRLHRILSIANGDYLKTLCEEKRPAIAARGADTVSDAELERVEAEVRKAAATPDVLSLPAVLAPADNGGVWEHPLLRRKFGFDAIRGEVTDFRLVCTREIVEGKVDPTLSWSVPDSAGPCTIFVNGTPGSGFTFLEDW
jgi:TonB family protein